MGSPTKLIIYSLSFLRLPPYLISITPGISKINRYKFNSPGSINLTSCLFYCGLKNMTIELYLKAGPKGNDVGDCPFAQFIRCILNHKDISYDLKPCTQETKPEWLLKDFEGRMPCLMHDGKGIIESSDIADYIEKIFPQNSLKTPEEVSKKASTFFPAMVKLCKSLPEDSGLEKNFLDQCQVLEDMLNSSGGPYLSGVSETLADYSLAPKLFHMTAIVPEFHPKVYDKLKQAYPKLNGYMETMFSHKHFCSTTYDKQLVIEAWKVKRAS